MNCKPGDLARIVHPAGYGRMVEVLYAAPMDHAFILPDGHRHNPSGPGHWVIQMLGSPIEARVGPDRQRLARYAACGDVWLRPIRDPGEDAKDEMLRPLPVEDGVPGPVHPAVTALELHAGIARSGERA